MFNALCTMNWILQRTSEISPLSPLSRWGSRGQEQSNVSEATHSCFPPEKIVRLPPRFTTEFHGVFLGHIEVITSSWFCKSTDKLGLISHDFLPSFPLCPRKMWDSQISPWPTTIATAGFHPNLTLPLSHFPTNMKKRDGSLETRTHVDFQNFRWNPS